MSEEIQTQDILPPPTVQQVIPPSEQKVTQTSIREPIPTFLSDHLDKFLLVIMIIFSYFGFMFLVHWNVAEQTLAFATATVSGLLGALIALVTGKK